MPPPSTFDAILVTHTHWDREWYSSVEEYRFRLAAMFERLLDILRREDTYHSFWLDGQTIPLDDLAAVRPDLLPEVEAALRAGRILVGPWYVLADQMLVSGEACVRNLLEGTCAAARFGQRNAVGYVPDNFGQMSQLPQVLLGFGIDNALFWRGYRLEDLDAAETWWTGADGSRVRVVCLVSGYSNARGVTEDLDATADRLDATMPRLKQYCGSGVLLLMNGIDHAHPTPRIEGVCRAIERRYPGLRVRHGCLADYMEAVRGRHDGHRELRGELYHVPGLDGCLSNRPEQKRLNRLLENRLAHYAEPLAVMAAGGGDIRSRAGFLRRAWRMLMRCHPHDTISGCHADAVAADLESRLRRGLQIAREVETISLSALAGSDPRAAASKTPCWLEVFNPLPWARHEVFEAEIELPAADLAGGLEATDQAGRPCPVAVLGVMPDSRRVYHDLRIPDCQEILRAKVIARMDLPPAGAASVKFTAKPQAMANLMESTAEQGGQGEQSAAPPAAPNVLEGPRLRAVVHPDGTFDLFDRTSGRRLDGLNRLQIEEDRGDLYAFRRSLNPTVSPARIGALSCTEDSPLRRTVAAQTALAARGVVLPVAVSVSLPAGKDRLEVCVEVENQADDFRIQAAFPIPSDGVGEAHMPFDLTPRHPQEPERFVRAADDMQPDSVTVTQPVQLMARFGLAGGGSLMLMSRGLYEYTWESAGEPRLTLMRAVGRITRGLRCHPAVGAQCHGRLAFEYAIRLFLDGPDAAAAAMREAMEYNLTPLALQTFAEPRKLRPALDFGNPWWMPAALKPREEPPGFVVRFWNAADSPQAGDLRVGLPFARVYRARMDEAPLAEMPFRGDIVPVTAGPKEVVTLVFENRARLAER